MVSLVKGQKVDLTKGNAGLKKILVGLGWDTNRIIAITNITKLLVPTVILLYLNSKFFT